MDLTEAKKEFGIAHRRFVEFVHNNFYEDPVAEEEDRDVWSGFEARLDALIDAAKVLGKQDYLFPREIKAEDSNA